MKSANEILSCNFSVEKFQTSVMEIIPISLKYQIENRVSEMKEITTTFGKPDFEFHDQSSVDIIIRKFKSSLKKKNMEFSRRELRILAFSLDHERKIIEYESEVEYALHLMILNWSDRYLYGLFIVLMRNWKMTNLNSLKLIEQLLLKKLTEYTGTNSTLCSLKGNIRFFSLSKGDVILGAELSIQNILLSNATEYLSIQESRFSDPYFSEVILTYYEKKKNNISVILEELMISLKKHNNNVKGTALSKKLMSKLILQANTPQFSSLQEKIKNESFKLVGDPEKDWTIYENASDIDKQQLMEAKNVLNEWITKQFINVFFNVCLNDTRRKKFWLRYASLITSFKVYGSTYTESLLKQDDRIAEFVSGRFKKVASNRDVSAFILTIGEYVLIEFSKEGYAFLAYKNNSNLTPNFNKKLDSVEDLRNPNLGMLIQTNGFREDYYDNGRLFHKDGREVWEIRFNKWIKQKALA
jgi:predicted CopG family antitoxin